jgi:hypothetical protein
MNIPALSQLSELKYDVNNNLFNNKNDDTMQDLYMKIEKLTEEVERLKKENMELNDLFD